MASEQGRAPQEVKRSVFYSGQALIPLIPRLTRDEARLLGERLGAGRACPTCGDKLELDRRPLHKQMARGLAVCAVLGRNGVPVHVGKIAAILHERAVDFRTANPVSDFSKLRWWGFVVEAGERNDGMWAITPKGRAFLLAQLDGPAAHYVFARRVVGETVERITIDDALEVTFDLSDVRPL